MIGCTNAEEIFVQFEHQISRSIVVYVRDEDEKMLLDLTKKKRKNVVGLVTISVYVNLQNTCRFR